ncbi:MAG: response regulator transcription factor [Gemmiger sp.]
MANILVAEDERAINNLVAANLRLVGHSCTQAYDGEQALALAAGGGFDLLLLDVMMPGVDGFEIKSRLPADQPVIFVTAKTGLNDKLRGLGLGADDYIVKPFEILELLARVESVLRRTCRNTDVFEFKDLRVDMTAHRVLRGGVPVELTPQEYALLEALVINRNLALSREKLLSIAWGYDYEGETRTVDVHIQRLRRKLGLEKEIQTVFKIGYRLNTR